MKKLLLLAVLLLPLSLFAQTPVAAEPQPDYKIAIGILGTYQAMGLQSEFRCSERLAVKAIGAITFDDKRRAGEYGGAGIGLLTYYIPTNNRFIEPVVGLGGIYSWYHWDLYDTRGTIHDVNVGAGFGTNLRFSSRFRSGLNVFVGNGFRAEYRGDEMTIVGRRLLVLPTLTFDFLI